MIKGKEKGITLIALVVTIVVLLILAGISISMLTGENGVIVQAREAKEKTEIGYEKEQVNLAYSSAKSKKIENGDNTPVNADDINEELNLQKADAIASGENPIIVKFKKSKREYEINENEEIDDDSDYNTANIYTYNPATGYITGIQEQYLEKTYIERPSSIPSQIKVASLQKKYYALDSDYRYMLKEEVGTSLKIPQEIDGVKIIGIDDNAFINLQNLKEIIIPEGIISIGNSAFAGCRNLTSINIPKGVTNIGDSVFLYCSSLTKINVLEDNKKYDSRNNCNAIIETSSNRLIQGCSTTIIPNDVTSIENSAFAGCRNLTSINIPKGVTNIGDSAFLYCSSLTSIVIPDGITSIGNNAFYNCSNLTSITIPNSVTSIGEYAFYNCGLINITIPDGVASIGNNAFCSCGNLTSINIPECVTRIGYGVFSHCSNLTSINIPNGVTNIGEYAFYNCSSLTSIIIPDGVTNIGRLAFSHCSNLTSINIPNGITSIKEYTFSDCSKLTSITIPASVIRIGYKIFDKCDYLKNINYIGTEEQWNAISIDESNKTILNSVNINYNYSN